jgi:hypothetical protein
MCTSRCQPYHLQVVRQATSSGVVAQKPAICRPRAFLSTRDPQVFPQLRVGNAHRPSDKGKTRPASLIFPIRQNRVIGSYCFGAAGFGAVVAGLGRVAAGADGAEGTGAATPDDVLYAVTTACVTSVL